MIHSKVLKRVWSKSKKMLYGSSGRLAVTGALLVSLIAHSNAETPTPIFPTTTPEMKKVIVEEAYYFWQMKYDPQVKLKLLTSRSESSYETPEEALIAILSAMYLQDHDWWLHSWTQAAIDFRIAEDKRQNQSPADWRQIWDKLLKDKQAVLTHRIETSKYVILGYNLVDAANNIVESNLVFTLENGKWLATNDLASDPVKWGWRKPEKKMQGTERKPSEPPKKIFRGYSKE